LFIKRITRTPLLLAAVMALFLSSPSHAAGELEAIEGLNQVLLETMQQGPALGFSGRYEKLGLPLVNLFSFRTMAEIGLQRHWSTIPDPDREAIVESFTRMSIATFASRFDDFKGESFSVESVKPGPRSLILISTLVHRPGKEAVNLTYVMRDGEAGPEVIDVLAQGRFSELARQRAEMSAIFKRSGAAGLIQSLDAKASELAAK
jgi:phospholipid transport system substrate-binding protein